MKNSAALDRKTKRKDITPYLVFAVPLAFLCIFLFWPMVTTLLRAFMKPGSGFALSNFGLEGFEKFFTSPMYLKSLKNSFIVGFAVTFLSLLIGVPMGFFVARTKMVGKKLIRSLAILPVIMPSFIGAFSWILLLGKNGIVRFAFNFLLSPFGIEFPTIYGLGGVIFCMTMTYYPFVFLLADGAFSGANALLEDSAMLMGADRKRIMRTITLPLIIPSLGAASLLVFIRAIGNFGIPAIIGGDQYVLPTLIYFRVNGFWDLNGAASIAVVNVVITGFVLYYQKRLVSKRKYEVVSAARSEVKQFENKSAVIVGFSFTVVVLVISLLPQITVVAMSFFESWTGFLPSGFTFVNYMKIPSSSSHEFFNSLFLSLVATFLTAIFGSVIAYITERRKPKGASILDMAIMSPFILPGTVVSVALISAFHNNGLFALGGTYTIIIISYMIRRTPYVYRSVSASLTQLNPSLEEASTIAGASWVYTFRRVSIPLILPGIISGSILTFSTLLQELSTTILLYNAKTRTVPIQIYNAVFENELGQASALSVILLIVVFIISYISNRSEKTSLAKGLKM